MSTRTMSIVEFNGQQIYKSDYTFAESIALLEIWKAKLIQEKIAAQDKGSGAAQTAPNRIQDPQRLDRKEVLNAAS